MNVLISSAGRRVSLVKIFQNHANVFCCDMAPNMSAACQIAPSFQVPKATSPHFIPTLLQIAKKHKINIIVPTIDTELLVLAQAKAQFLAENILIAISTPDIIKTFYLKTTTEAFFNRHNLPTPQIIHDPQNAKYPLFAKLNDSSSSIGACKVESYEQAKALHHNYILQEFIDGDEYSVDAFFDKHSNLICAVPRARLEIRCGEVNKSRTIKDSQILNTIRHLSSYLKGAYGALNIQLFKTKNRIYLIEINPRFGGGYPLSYFAGADFAKFLIDDYCNKPLSYTQEWLDNKLMLRYDDQIII
ncbi:MAG: ATP-grasp domain-containing protein [Epsilonproteobacteria bacterium]|nr:ATP-grasp domain-containing protein [Campylobacterota bacterium]